MSMYSRLISEATGCTDGENLRAIEDIMRHDIFHSTLDWQTLEQLADGAKQALQIHCEMIASQLVSGEREGLESYRALGLVERDK